MNDDWFDDRPLRPAPAMLLPRVRRRPSERNLRIHELVRVRHERQEDVAAGHGLTQQRVSAICSQVEAWHNRQAASPDFEAIDAQARRQRLLECRAREETLLVLALRGALAERKSLVSLKRVTTAEGTLETRTERGVAANPAWLKMVRASSQSLARINAELGVDVQTSALADEIERLWGEMAGEREHNTEGANEVGSGEQPGTAGQAGQANSGTHGAVAELASVPGISTVGSLATSATSCDDGG